MAPVRAPSEANHRLLVAIFDEQDRLGMSNTDLAARSGLKSMTMGKVSRLRRGHHGATIQDVEALATVVRLRLELVPRS